ncbi:MAG: type II secretion system F family protein [Chloroflexi bacterium]|uniref:Type II secretion system F family protein n=1 Tax=Candidatus Chlorohelix allophototropha TaxID=3003348 RepID=A0A8T7M4X1_9CHLR|nr:type II secretion system F family protein [Chloroflexota bacterium]WJW70273.1 type II secretion system F family protein [Chloroflexota bacterium L227-S17]
MDELFDALRQAIFPGGQPAIALLMLPLALGLYLVASGLIGLIWPVRALEPSEEEKVRLEMEAVGEARRRQERESHPLYGSGYLERNLRPLTEMVGRQILQALNRVGLGRSGRDELQRKLDIEAKGETVSGFFGQQFFSGVVVALTGLGLQVAWGLEFSALTFLGLFSLGFYYPALALNRTVRRMREDVAAQLPTLIDLLSINARSGMGLEQALEVAVARGEGTLPEAIRKAFVDARYMRKRYEAQRRRSGTGGLTLLGELEEESAEELKARYDRPDSNPTFDALAELARRFELEELEDFVAALETSAAKGARITEVLHNQSLMMRDKKLELLLAAGSRSQVKIIFPLALFILPAFILLVLTPALLQVAAFGS